MSSSAFSALRRFARPAARTVLERCELCGLVLPPVHRHLIELATRKIACSCDPCALLFQNAVKARYKLIPRDARAFPNFQMTDEEWDGLGLPIDLAFFLYNTPGEKMIALYPSPAGPIESLLPLGAWESLVRQNRFLAEMEPDVEALLVNRAGAAREYFVAPVDTCYELVGTIRLHWRGFSGGDEVWRAIEVFFTRLRESALPYGSHPAR